MQLSQSNDWSSSCDHFRPQLHQSALCLKQSRTLSLINLLGYTSNLATTKILFYVHLHNKSCDDDITVVIHDTWLLHTLAFVRFLFVHGQKVSANVLASDSNWHRLTLSNLTRITAAYLSKHPKHQSGDAQESRDCVRCLVLQHGKFATLSMDASFAEGQQPKSASVSNLKHDLPFDAACCCSWPWSNV